MVQDGGVDQCECEGVEMWMRMLVVMMMMIWIVNNNIVIGKGGEEFRRVGETAQEFVLCIPLCILLEFGEGGGGGDI